MKKRRFNKALIILLIISALLVGASAFMSLLGYSSYVRNAAGIVFTPIQKGFSSLIEGISSAVKGDSYEALESENASLRDRISELELELAGAEKAKEENDRLRAYLSLKEEDLSLEFEECRVIGREGRNVYTVLTLDKGTYHGIDSGMPVVCDKGLVGRIYEVGLTWSKAVLITDDSFSVGVYVDRTGEVGMLTGDFDARKEGSMILTYLSEDSDVREGDYVYTSGSGDTYPYGLLAGRVTRVFFDAYSREKRAVVKPVADVEALGRLMVVTSYEKAYQ